jgi:serine/threonine-protein kinase
VLTLAYLADYYAMLGDREQADRHIQRALKLGPNNGEVLFRAALVHNHFGQTEEALADLNKAVQAGYSRTVIRDTPDFRNLQENARFKALIESTGSTDRP